MATIDVGPLRRHRDFRLLFVGQGVSFFGSMLTYVAIPYQAYQLSGSSLVVGLLSLAELGPLLLTAFIGGALRTRSCRTRSWQCSSWSARSWRVSTVSSVRRSTPSSRVSSSGTS